MNDTFSGRFEVLRQLAAKYWKPILSFAATVPAALNGLQAALDLSKIQSVLNYKEYTLPGVASDPITRYWLIGFGKTKKYSLL